MSEFSHSTRNYYSHNVLLDVMARIIQTLKFPSTPQLISAVVHHECDGRTKEHLNAKCPTPKLQYVYIMTNKT